MLRLKIMCAASGAVLFESSNAKITIHIYMYQMESTMEAASSSTDKTWNRWPHRHRFFSRIKCCCFFLLFFVHPNESFEMIMSFVSRLFVGAKMIKQLNLFRMQCSRISGKIIMVFNVYPFRNFAAAAIAVALVALPNGNKRNAQKLHSLQQRRFANAEQQKSSLENLFMKISYVNLRLSVQRFVLSASSKQKHVIANQFFVYFIWLLRFRFRGIFSSADEKWREKNENVNAIYFRKILKESLSMIAHCREFKCETSLIYWELPWSQATECFDAFLNSFSFFLLFSPVSFLLQIKQSY